MWSRISISNATAAQQYIVYDDAQARIFTLVDSWLD